MESVDVAALRGAYDCMWLRSSSGVWVKESCVGLELVMMVWVGGVSVTGKPKLVIININ